jgi:hypothetical protein
MYEMSLLALTAKNTVLRYSSPCVSDAPLLYGASIAAISELPIVGDFASNGPDLYLNAPGV